MVGERRWCHRPEATCEMASLMATTTTNHPLINPSPRKRELTRIDHNTPRYTTNTMISSAMAINGEATWVKSKVGCHINALALRLGRSCLARSHGAPFCFGPAVAAWFNYTCALSAQRPSSVSIHPSPQSRQHSPISPPHTPCASSRFSRTMR